MRIFYFVITGRTAGFAQASRLDIIVRRDVIEKFAAQLNTNIKIHIRRARPRARYLLEKKKEIK